MKNRIASFALGLSVLAATAFAEDAPTPITQATPVQQAAPNVESVDILKQNQAERTRDQPGNNAPTWRIVKEGTKNYSSLPAKEAGVLIQPKAQFPGQGHAVTAGEAWRNYRNGPLTFYGGWLILLALAGVAAMYVIVGPIRTKEPSTGRVIERFTMLERMAHATVAGSFVVLALTGLTMLFGKHVLMPVIGHAAFGYLTYLFKTVHNFVGPLFALGMIVTFAIFVKDNFPGKGDLRWILTMGRDPNSGRFNAGEKVWFWGGLTLLGIVLTASGFVLDMLVPGIDYTRGNMQIANVIHLAGAVLFVAGSFGHIYMGTIGTEGALDAMRTGYVDDTWAKEHHRLWYEQVERGEIPRVRTQESATGSPAGGPANAV